MRGLGIRSIASALAAAGRAVACVVTAGTLLCSAPSSAGTIYDLVAITTNPSFVGSFSIRWDDTGDNLLHLGEITDFSGVNLPIVPAFRTTVVCVPGIANVSTQSSCSISGNVWAFFGGSDTNTTFANPTLWTYQIVP